MILRLLLILSFFSLFHVAAQAQNTENSLLPEINPQDIEIRSEFKARFPGLRRQPILGFNPKPRVYQIDPNRMPFMETREEAVAGIEVTKLDRPEPPQRTFLESPNHQKMYVLAGFGSFTTADIEAYGIIHKTENELLSANLNLYSTEGHLETQESDERYFDFQADYQQKTSKNWQFGIHVGVLADKFKLFKLNSTDTPEKNNSGLNAAVTIEKTKTAFSGTKFELGGTLFTSGISEAVNCTMGCYGGDISEKTYFASYNFKWAGQRIYEVMGVSASLDGGNNYVTDVINDNWLHLKSAFEYERLINFKTTITVRGGIQYVSDSFSEKTYVVPELSLKHTLSPNLSVSANAYARPEMRTMQEHQQINRFLDENNQLRHSYNLGINGEVAYKLIEGNAVYGGLSYEHVRDYSFYRRKDLSGLQEFYEIHYGDANIFELYAGISQQLVPEKFWLDARIYGRSPSLSDSGNIPYEERLGLESSLSYKPFSKLTLNAWAQYIGEREDPASNVPLDAFVLVNGGAEYQINETFGLYAKVLNILGQKYQIWNGYQERPLQVFGGITFKF